MSFLPGFSIYLPDPTPYGTSIPTSNPTPRPSNQYSTAKERVQSFLDTSPPDPQVTKSSPFFRAPRETRDQIYDLLLQGLVSKFREGYLLIRLRYCGDLFDNPKKLPLLSSNSTGLPNWFLVCKQFLAEALVQFHYRSLCVNYQECSFTEPSPFRLLSLYRLRKLDHNRTARVSLELKGRDGIGQDGSAVLLPNIHPMRNNFAAPRYLQEHLAGKEHTIKHLVFSFLFKTHQYPWVRNVAQWKADMSFFELFGSDFDCVSFSILYLSTIVSGPIDVNELQATAIMFNLMQRELERVGKFLVGVERGGGWSVRDWITEEKICSTLKRHDRLIQQWHIEIRRENANVCMRNISHPGLRGWWADHMYFKRTSGPSDILAAFEVDGESVENGPMRLEVDEGTGGSLPIPADTGLEPIEKFSWTRAVREGRTIEWSQHFRGFG